MPDNDSITQLRKRANQPGGCLKRLRMRLGLTTRKVAELSWVMATEQNCEEYALSHARLVQIEKERSIPSIHKLFTLSSIYGVPIDEMLSIYLDLQSAKRIRGLMQFPLTHLAALEDRSSNRPIAIPIQSTPALMAAETKLLSQGTAGLAELSGPLTEHLNLPKSRYAFIGLSDYTMYPLIRPGSVVQIDDTQKVAKPGRYRTEFDRPIYFLELRSGYLCSWCEIQGGRLVAVPHPLSPCQTRIFAYPAEAEIIGCVTGVAMRLVREDDRTSWRKPERDIADSMDEAVSDARAHAVAANS